MATQNLNAFLINYIVKSRETEDFSRDWMLETLETPVLSSAEVSAVISGRLSGERLVSNIQKKVPDINFTEEMLDGITISPRGEGVFSYQRPINLPRHMSKKAQAIHIMKHCDNFSLISSFLEDKFEIPSYMAKNILTNGSDFLERLWPKPVIWAKKIDLLHNKVKDGLDKKNLDFIYKKLEEKGIEEIRSDILVSANIQEFTIADFLELQHNEPHIEIEKKGKLVNVYSLKDTSLIYENQRLAAQALKMIWPHKKDPLDEFIIEGLTRGVFTIEELL